MQLFIDAKAPLIPILLKNIQFSLFHFSFLLDVPLGEKNAAFGLPSPSAARSSTKERWADNDKNDDNSEGDGDGDGDGDGPSDGDAAQGGRRNGRSSSKGKKDFTDGDILDIQVVRMYLCTLSFIYFATFITYLYSFLPFFYRI